MKKIKKKKHGEKCHKNGPKLILMCNDKLINYSPNCSNKISKITSINNNNHHPKGKIDTDLLH